MSSQVVTGGTPLKKRPSFTRKKTDEAFKAPTSIRAKLRASGNEYVGLQVSSSDAVCIETMLSNSRSST
jgi:hypothetical protein